MQETNRFSLSPQSWVRRRLEPGVIIEGRYYLVANLASKSIYDAYSAIDLDSRTQVTLKVLKGERDGGLNQVELANIVERNQAIVRLNHPNISTRDVCFLSGRPILVSDCWAHQTLSSHIRKRGTFSQAQALAYVVQITAATLAAHQIGVSHQNISPCTISLGQHHEIYLNDFALFASLGRNWTESELTITDGNRAEILSPFLAPEQVEGRQSEGDHLSDIWSIGMVLYHLIFDCQPKAPDSTNTARTLRNVNPGIAYIIFGCLRTERHLRFQSLSEVYALLRQVQNSSLPPPPIHPAENPGRTRGTSPWALVFAFTAGLVIALLSQLR